MKHFLKRNAQLVKEDDGYSIYKINKNGRDLYIYFLSKRFSKYQNIILKEDGTVIIEYMYMITFIFRPHPVRKVLCKPIIDNSHLNFVVYKGVPNMVKGLDNGVYKLFDNSWQNKFIYFTSAKEFQGIFD